MSATIRLPREATPLRGSSHGIGTGAWQRPAEIDPLRHAGSALLVAAGALLPWIAALASGIGSDAEGPTVAAGWIGLDVAEAATLAAAGAGVLLRRSWASPLAALATLLLVLDGLVDTSTAAPGTAAFLAWLMAGLAEAPLAVLCATVAVVSARGPRRSRRRGA